MATGYLDKFRGTLNKVQMQQINRLLRQKRESGEILNLEEYKKELARLTTELSSEEIQPTLELFLAENRQPISSETHNFMLERIEDDLNAGFGEATIIGETLTAHDTLVTNVSLRSLRQSLAQLESRVRQLRFLQSNAYGLDQAQFNTFDIGQDLATPRTDSRAGILFRDHANNESINANQDAAIDAVGQFLALGPERKIPVDAIAARHIFDHEASQSNLTVKYENNDVNRIIDLERGTYWLYSYLFSDIQSTGVIAKFEIDLAGTADINYIDLYPAAPYPMTLLSIAYRTQYSAIETIWSGELDLNGSQKVFFPKITTNRIYVTVRQDNYLESQFEVNDDATIFFRADTDLEVAPSLDLVASRLRSIFASAVVLEDIFGIPVTGTPGESVRYFEYIVGFDLIQAGFNTYDTRGIWVSRPLDVDSPAVLALSVDEERPFGNSFIDLSSVEPDDLDDAFYHASTEYWIVKRNFDSEGALIDTDIFPVLPLGESRIYHERLSLTAKTSGSSQNDVGFLNFYSTDDVNTKIYRNGTLLEEAADWTFYTSFDVTLPSFGLPMRRAIRILEPRTSDIYTITYNPLLSNVAGIPADLDNPGLSEIVDLLGDLSARLIANNVIVFSADKGIKAVVRSEVFLVVLLRSNSPLRYVTPRINEYLLGTGSGDLSKYV